MFNILVQNKCVICGECRREENRNHLKYTDENGYSGHKVQRMA